MLKLAGKFLHKSDKYVEPFPAQAILIYRISAVQLMTHFPE